jgi:hypothetical protein
MDEFNINYNSDNSDDKNNINTIDSKDDTNDNNNDNQPNSGQNKKYDILPGVGEIILWAANDKRGYLIDINGSWFVFVILVFQCNLLILNIILN